jgi:hypothetical protein
MEIYLLPLGRQKQYFTSPSDVRRPEGAPMLSEPTRGSSNTTGSEYYTLVDHGRL